ncbi:uncharacterized protein Z519_12817 [Cladophialophora bantiana CBS 173.52]|uniref:Uncharacterized protein n=1 Tax=Cladophialophora bantiana (strain ATCC 10958 / CBS 173.52 / CDC B-1940 / NIH 8579) TaxID=1442370 RepID=A0A0D2H003_CLAB1|nr:uncharacterized protein Z519_12817 [Cladophialophora bantiana CBS 173.52]KIW86578.1 hypothetical protein Z519_12817 [Cladophialophora bantiana CBS 173.52]
MLTPCEVPASCVRRAQELLAANEACGRGGPGAPAPVEVRGLADILSREMQTAAARAARLAPGLPAVGGARAANAAPGSPGVASVSPVVQMGLLLEAVRVGVDTLRQRWNFEPYEWGDETFGVSSSEEDDDDEDEEGAN